MLSPKTWPGGVPAGRAPKLTVSCIAPRGSTVLPTLHEALVKDEVLVPDPVGGLLRFARDYVFASPSAAAAVVTGRNANGRIEWRIQGSGMNFGDWQLRDIDSGEHAASS